MQIFIDSANLDEIKEAISWGIVDGCTTNPKIVSASKMIISGIKGTEIWGPVVAEVAVWY